MSSAEQRNIFKDISHSAVLKSSKAFSIAGDNQGLLKYFAIDGKQFSNRDNADPEDLLLIEQYYGDDWDKFTEDYAEFTRRNNLRVSRLVNIKAIQNSLKQIFSWIPGERIINPEFGSRLRRMLYQGITRHNVE